MSQQSSEKLARSLLDPSSREVLWPVLFAGVKNVVKANNLNNDTLSCIKGWLKANDSQLHIPLLGVTVLHTISLNSSTTVRTQMASPKLFQRLEKQLSRPQGPQVATALVQLLVDWTHLFNQEELGIRSQALLDQPRYRPMAAGCGPSPAVLAMKEEMQLGVPPVAPIRGEDFIRWMYRGASNIDWNPSVTACSGGGGSGTGGFSGWPSVLSGGLPGASPPPITTHAVPELYQRMQADAQRMMPALAACRTAARLQLQNELSTAMDAAYREAERCSQWRRRVQDYTQRCDDPRSLSAVLAATDVINQALQDWQNFTSKEVFDTLRIVVPPPPPTMRRAASGTTTSRSATATAAGGSGSRPQGGGGGGKATDIMDLLGLAHTNVSSSVHPLPSAATAAAAPSTQHPTARGVSTNPFAAASSSNGTANPSPPSGIELRRPSLNPFAAAHPQPLQPQPAQTRGPSVTPVRVPAADWDPFTPAPPQPPSTQPAAPATAAGRVVSWGSSPFPQDPASLVWGSAVSYNKNTSSQAAPSSSALVSPSGTSVTSTASTPTDGGAATAPWTGGSPRAPGGSTTAATSTSMPSYLQPFRDLLIESTSSSAATPNQAPRPLGSGGTAVPATAAAATTGAGLQPFSGTATNGCSGSSGSNGGSAAASVLDWQPEFERLSSELMFLWASSAAASSSSSPSSHRAPPSSLASASSAANKAPGGADGEAAALLPTVLRHVRGMCEALAAQHARKVAAAVAAAAAPLPHSTLSGSALTAQGRGSTAVGGGLGQLRAVASSAVISSTTGGSGAGTAAAAAMTTAENGSLGFGNGQAVGAGSWVHFGVGGRPPAVGPLQQHLIQQQYTQQPQQPQQQRLNGAVQGILMVKGNGRVVAPDESLI